LKHSVSSAKLFGGAPSDYFTIHEIIDVSKMFIPDWRHRALMHSTFGIYLLEKYILGHTFKRKSDGLGVCTRTVASQHILEDLGVLLTPGEFLREMPIRNWMNRVDEKTKVRLQRMSIAGTTEPSNIEEIITWYSYKNSKPLKNGKYLVKMSDPNLLDDTLIMYYDCSGEWVCKEAILEIKYYDNLYWARLPIGPSS